MLSSIYLFASALTLATDGFLVSRAALHPLILREWYGGTSDPVCVSLDWNNWLITTFSLAGEKKKKLMHEDKIQVRKLDILHFEVRRHTVGGKRINLK